MSSNTGQQTKKSTEEKPKTSREDELKVEELEERIAPQPFHPRG